MTTETQQAPNLSNTETLKSLISTSSEWFKGLGLPQQTKPTGLGAEYAFPDNVTQLTTVQLGDLQLKLTGYHTYAMKLLGKEEGELSAIEVVYNYRLGLAVNNEHHRPRDGRAPAREILEAVAISKDNTLMSLQQTILGRRLRAKHLETQVEIYKEHLAKLSREQSRREIRGETY